MSLAWLISEFDLVLFETTEQVVRIPAGIPITLIKFLVVSIGLSRKLTEYFCG